MSPRETGSGGSPPGRHKRTVTDDEVRAVGAEPWSWGSGTSGVRAIVTQTADPRWSDLDAGWFPDLSIVVDGRNSLAALDLPAGVRLRGIGRK